MDGKNHSRVPLAAIFIVRHTPYLADAEYLVIFLLARHRISRNLQPYQSGETSPGDGCHGQLGVAKPVARDVQVEQRR